MTPQGNVLPSWFEAILNALPDAVYLAGEDGTILFVNPPVERQLGWQASVLLG
ncbi:MAG: PAS domain-containing protein, partial [Bacteroidetes bacterium]|nr:PAS domain-containing protein [Bacteroidota bacterium]